MKAKIVIELHCDDIISLIVNCLGQRFFEWSMINFKLKNRDKIKLWERVQPSLTSANNSARGLHTLKNKIISRKTVSG